MRCWPLVTWRVRKWDRFKIWKEYWGKFREPQVSPAFLSKVAELPYCPSPAVDLGHRPRLQTRILALYQYIAKFRLKGLSQCYRIRQSHTGRWASVGWVCEEEDANLAPEKKTWLPDSPADYCNYPPVSGNCKLTLTRYYYDTLTFNCEPFIFSGCGSNRNNFKQKYICEKFCLPER